MKASIVLAATLLFLGLNANAAEPMVELDRSAAAALRDPATHAHPTIVALWSFDCIHCKTNLKRFAALMNAHPEIRLATVAVEPASAALGDLLDRMEVGGRRFAYGSGDAPEALAYALDPRWRGELPRTLFFDGQGGVVARSGVVDEGEVRTLLGISPR